MRAWLYLIAAAIAGAIVTTPALIVLIFMGGSFDDALVAALATLMLVVGIAVVSMRDIIRCGLAMIVCFLSLAGIYVTLGAPMVAAAQVIVYIGAISVLILFAIMLTQDKAAPARLDLPDPGRAGGDRRDHRRGPRRARRVRHGLGRRDASRVRVATDDARPRPLPRLRPAVRGRQRAAPRRRRRRRVPRQARAGRRQSCTSPTRSTRT